MLLAISCSSVATGGGGGGGGEEEEEEEGRIGGLVGREGEISGVGSNCAVGMFFLVAMVLCE